MVQTDFDLFPFFSGAYALYLAIPSNSMQQERSMEGRDGQ